MAGIASDSVMVLPKNSNSRCASSGSQRVLGVVVAVHDVLHAVWRTEHAEEEPPVVALQRLLRQLSSPAHRELDVLHERLGVELLVLHLVGHARPAQRLERLADPSLELGAEAARLRHGLPERRRRRVDVERGQVELEVVAQADELGTRNRPGVDQRVDLERQAVPVGPLALPELLALAGDRHGRAVRRALDLHRQADAVEVLLRRVLGQLLLELVTLVAQLGRRAPTDVAGELLVQRRYALRELALLEEVERAVDVRLERPARLIDAEDRARVGRARGVPLGRAAELQLGVGVDEPGAVARPADVGDAETAQNARSGHGGLVEGEGGVEHEAVDSSARSVRPEAVGLDRVLVDVRHLGRDVGLEGRGAIRADAAEHGGQQAGQRLVHAQHEGEQEQEREKDRAAADARELALAPGHGELHEPRVLEVRNRDRLDRQVALRRRHRRAVDLAVDEARHAVLDRVDPGVQRRPARGRLGRIRRVERREGAACGELRQVRETSLLHHALGRASVRAVEADNDDAPVLGGAWQARRAQCEQDDKERAREGEALDHVLGLTREAGRGVGSSDRARAGRTARRRCGLRGAHGSVGGIQDPCQSAEECIELRSRAGAATRRSSRSPS
jgi:hypothetical protein